MKKVTCTVFLLLALCLFAFVGCASPDSSSPSSTPDVKPTQKPVELTDAAELLEGAVSKLSQQNGVDMGAELKMSFVGGGITMEIPVVGEIKIIGNEGSGIEMLTTATLEMLGQKMQTTTYEKDGKVYTDNGTGLKLITDAEREADGDSAVLLEEYLTKLKDLMKNAVAKQENGVSTIEVTIPGNTMKELLEESNMGLGGDLTGGLLPSENGTVDLEDTVITMTIDAEGYLTGISGNLSVTTTSTQEGTSMTGSLTCSIKLTLRNPGQPVTITPPTDLDEYMTEEEYQQLMLAVMGLFDEEGNPAANYEAQLSALKNEYGSDAVEAILAMLAQPEQ